MIRLIFLTLLFFSYTLKADQNHEIQGIRQAVLDYIESQEQVLPERMQRSLDPQLAKRTYWLGTDGEEFIMHSSYETMLKIAASYNKNGDKFGLNPKKDIEIFDVDQRVASVKLTVDDWIDYMHLYKNQEGQWKVINVLWQFHDTSKQKSQ
ncbi:nuclear transport factor 2 family protein [Marinicella sp. W31]|uniref:nuclear transport factor 2 family protein n=1 Tax=Marinicella sp. W31 TaxID=3023713 RepID=UPI003757F618